MKRIIENKKQITNWILVIFLVVSMSFITIYLCGDYWIDKFIRMEYMQERIWGRVSKLSHIHALQYLRIGTYQKYETEHFFIYYKTKDKELLQKIIRSAEKIYQPVSNKMRYERQEKTPIVLVDDSENREYNQFGGLIRINEKIVDDEQYTPEEIISHEFTHVIVSDLTRENILTWLNEGIAVYIQVSITEKMPYDIHEKDFDYTYNFYELEDNFKAIPSNQAYFQSYLVVKYIVSNYGEDTLLKIIAELKDDRIKEETLFKKYLGMDYKMFYEKIVEYKKELKEKN